ncbi:amidohydrolase family protein [soil metagenome]
MKQILFFLLLCCSSLCKAQKTSLDKNNASQVKPAVALPNAKIIITNVTVLDVEKQKLIRNVTVEINDGIITSISNKGTAVSAAGTPPTIIDGTGKFLMPGMTDAHVHFSQSGGLYTRPDAINLKKYMPYEKDIEWGHANMEDACKRYLQNGITSVIDVGSTVNFLEQRKKFSDDNNAPAIYMTGPLITSYEPDPFKKLGNDDPFLFVTNEEDGRKMVQRELPNNPDFIKIWYIALGNDKEAAARKFFPTAKAIIDEAHKNNLKVAVHATERITAQLAAEAGCDYLVHSVDDEILSDDFIKLLKSRNIILCPTLIAYEGYNRTFGQDLNFSTRELRLANPVQLGSLFDLEHIPEPGMIGGYKKSVTNRKAATAKMDSISLVNLKRLTDAGVKIAAGTDAGNIGTLHASSLLKEMQTMKKSGISNWQVLQSATINPAYILGKEKEYGSIAIGKKANLVLLNANPVENIDNLQQIDIVVNKGFIIRPDTLIKETPLTLVQRQLNAYNAHNLEAFLEPYAEDVELYNFPNTLLWKGKEKMRKDYAFLKTASNLHCEIKERIIQDNIIIDQESVTGFGNKPVTATVIYEVKNNKIVKVYFISND